MNHEVERAHWRALGREMKRRLFDPLGHPSFVLYFLGFTLGLGALGVWWEVLCRFADFSRLNGHPTTDCWSIINAITTYLVAVAAASLMDLMLRPEQEGFRAFRVVASLACWISVALGVIGLMAPQVWLGLTAALVGFAIALTTWWVVNADNEALHDDPAPDATTGGSTSQALAGSLDGLQT